MGSSQSSTFVETFIKVVTLFIVLSAQGFTIYSHFSTKFEKLNAKVFELEKSELIYRLELETIKQDIDNNIIHIEDLQAEVDGLERLTSENFKTILGVKRDIDTRKQ